MAVKKSSTPRKPLQRVTRSNAPNSPVETPPSTPKVRRTYSHRKGRVEDEVQAKTPKRKALSSPPDTPSRSKRRHKDTDIFPLELPTSPPAEICLGQQKRVVLQALQSSLPFDTDETEASTNQIAYNQLTQLLMGSVDRGEGNSCLVLGPSGSGKSQLVNHCISNLPNKPIVIRLSGWVQQNDREAHRELARQLMAQTTGILDTKDNDEDEDPFVVLPGSEPSTLSPASHFHSVIPTLERPTVIIIDAFDRFTHHPRQSLLYCLLDTVQGCRTSPENKGIAVLGITSRMDTVNLLEKRVKSRFSGRMIRTAAPASLDDWFRIARIALSTPIEDQDEWNEAWRAGVEDFLSDSNTERILKETFSVTRDIRTLSRILTSAVVTLSHRSPALCSDQLAASTELQHSRPQPNYLRDLPYPAVALLVASVHAETAGYPFVTFEMLHDYFRIQVRASSAAPVQVNGGSIGMLGCDRQVLLGAFERLVTLRIFIPVAAAAGIAREFIKYRFVLAREDVKVVVEKTGQLNLRNWLNRSQ